LNKRVLIIGLFSDTTKFPITQAGELAKLLKANGYEVLTTSRFRNKLIRLLDIILSIIVNKNKFDVAIVQFYSGNSLIWQHIACSLAKWLEKKLIITIHGGGVPRRIKIYPRRYLPLLKKADLITCPSEYIISELLQYGIFAKLIENSIPLESYPFVEKASIKPTLLWMRGLSPIYNPIMAVHVVKELKMSYPSIKLYIGGTDMGMKNEIESLIHSMALQENIEIVGFMDHAKKIEFAGKADIFISTSKIDNAPVCFTEMWAMGLPIISTNVGGIPFLIENNKTGILVEDGNAIEMATAVKKVIESSAFVQQIITNGRMHTQKYSEEKVAVKWDAALKNL
jgi:glycosyltransferase involved in cell wall biosynthesis